MTNVIDLFNLITVSLVHVFTLHYANSLRSLW